MHCRFPVVLVSAVLATAVPAFASGQMFVATGRDTLRSLPGVEVVVEAPQTDIWTADLSAAALRAAVVERLRAGGVEVYSAQHENPGPAKAYVYVHLNGLPLPSGGGYVVGLQVHLRQTVRSTVTDSQIVDAMTWDAHNVLGVPAGGLAAVREEVLAAIDLFVQDWRAVHR